MTIPSRLVMPLRVQAPHQPLRAPLLVAANDLRARAEKNLEFLSLDNSNDGEVKLDDFLLSFAQPILLDFSPLFPAPGSFLGSGSFLVFFLRCFVPSLLLRESSFFVARIARCSLSRRVLSFKTRRERESGYGCGCGC